MRRKFLSVVLCVCMMLTMAPFAFAEGDGESNSAVAKIGDVTYATFDSALSNAKAGDTITLLENVTVHDTDTNMWRTTIDTPITLDLNGKTIFGPNDMGNNSYNFAVLYICADTTIIDSASNGGINAQTNGAYCINVMNGAQLTINAGTYYGGGTAVQVQKGTLIINGGTFNCEPYSNPTYGYKFLINCVDSAYKDGTAKIIIKGGSFINYDPSDSASENPRGNFCAPGYVAVKNDDTEKPVWTVEDHRVADVDGTGYTTLASAVEAADNKTVTLLKDVTEDLVIPADKTVTLNLNGKKLTNVSSNTITNNGTLTITGEGTVDNVTHAKAAVWNNVGGTVIIDGGAYTRSAEASTSSTNSGNNSYYVIDNYGTLTINKGTFKFSDNNTGAFSSLIHNGWYDGTENTSGQNAIMTINDGNFTQGTGGKITVKNDDYGELEIKGGVFTQPQSNYYCVYNYNIAKISGGTINGYVGNKYANATCDKGLLEISNEAVINGDIQSGTAASQESSSEKNLIKITGNAKVAGAITSADVKYVTVSGGYFTTDPTPYCGKDGDGNQFTGIPSTEPGYAFTVGRASTEVKPATAAPAVDDTKISGEDRATAKEVSESVTDSNNVLSAAASSVATEIPNKQISAAKTQLENTLHPADGTAIFTYIQAYLKVTPTAVIKDETGNTITSITMDIQPMYRVVASTKENANEIVIEPTSGESKNAVVLNGSDTKLANIQTMEISLELPSTFIVNTNNNQVYVQHKGHEYTATVTKDANNKLIATFTNPDGFSEFTISSTSTAVAKIGDNSYTTLQAAIDAVQNNETITLLKDTNENVTVSKAIKFTLAGKNQLKGSIAAGSKYSMTTSEINGNTEYTFTYVGGGSSSSISAPTTYAVNVNAATNGAVAADKKTASKGTTVTVTASPSKGYVVDAVKVVDKDGKDVAVTEKDGKYVFTMPASAVTVTGSFKAETPAPVALPFTDVKSGNWFYDAVKYAYEQGLMTGTSATTFAPNGTMNRAMIVTVLYRLEKSPAVTGASKFTDVPAGQWYSDAVAWAAANKIVNGYDETTFGPMNAVTREQMAAILFRYEQVKGLENVTLEENLNRFPDQNKISAYAIPALQWAVGQKIINGNADGTLDPTGTATRAQVAQIFTNLLNK